MVDRAHELGVSKPVAGKIAARSCRTMDVRRTLTHLKKLAASGRPGLSQNRPSNAGPHARRRLLFVGEGAGDAVGRVMGKTARTCSAHIWQNAVA